MTSFCTNCGAAFAEGDRWCGGCGSARFQDEGSVQGVQTHPGIQASSPQWMNALPLPLQRIELLCGSAAAVGILLILFQSIIGFGFSSIGRLFFASNFSNIIGSLGAIAPVGLGIYFQISKPQDPRGQAFLRLGALVVSLIGVVVASAILFGNWPDALWRKGIILIATAGCLVGAVPAILSFIPRIKTIPTLLKTFSPKTWVLSAVALVLLIGSGLFSRPIALVAHGSDMWGELGLGTVLLPVTLAVFVFLLLMIQLDDVQRVVGAATILVVHGATFAQSIVLWGLFPSDYRWVVEPTIGSVFYDLIFAAVVVGILLPIGKTFSKQGGQP
jgi:hypothetical protein